MLTGFNTDFRYKGTVYHVQTEDNGVGNPYIVTLLYKGGAILASRKTSYADIIKSEYLEKVVMDLMKQQHKQVVKDLIGGKLGPVEDTRDTGVKDTEGPGPAGAADADKGLDSIILDYLSGLDDR